MNEHLMFNIAKQIKTKEGVSKLSLSTFNVNPSRKSIITTQFNPQSKVNRHLRYAHQRLDEKEL